MARMANRLAALTCLLAAWAPAALGADASPPKLDQPFGLAEEGQRLRREINLHNLLNGLHLSAAQMERIVALAEEAAALRREVYGERNDRAVRVVETYREILEVVRAGGRIPKALEGMGVMMEIAEKRFHKRYFGGMERLEQQVWETLTPAQRDVFEGYQPCLIPPKNLKDPVRVGQAHDDEGERQLLALARRLPEEDFDRECRRVLDIHLSVQEKFLGRLTPPERETELRRMVEVCRRARTLTEVDFALKAGDFARDLALDRPKDMFKEKAEAFFDLVRRFQGGSIGKLAEHFLDPIVIPILRERIARADARAAATPRDLASEAGARPAGAGCATRPGEGPGVKRKVRLAEVMGILGMDGATRERFQSAFLKGKAAHLKVLQTPMADGTTAFQRFLEIQALPEAKREAAIHALFAQLQEPLPGRESSPMEYILRIEMGLDEQFREMLAPAQYEKLRSLVDEYLEQIEPGEGKKMHVRELCEKLSLDAGQAEALGKALREGQGKAFQLLSTPDATGQKPIEAILRLGTLPEAERGEALQAFLAALSNRIPGREQTYAEALEAIKGEIEAAFREILPPAAFRAYQALRVDLLDVETGE